MNAVQEMLSPERLRLPEYPRVESIRAYNYTDSIGEPAIAVMVIVADPPGDRFYTSSELEPIREEIFRVVRASGSERFPYINFRIASEDAELRAA